MDPATIGLLVNVGILGASYTYHRLIREKPEFPKPDREIRLPTSTEGAPIPILYGRCRVDRPVLAWTSSTPAATPFQQDVTGGSDNFLQAGFFYQLDMFFVIAMAIARGNSTNRLGTIYAGSNALLLKSQSGHPNVTSLDELTGEGGYERNTRYAQVWNDANIHRPPCQGEVEFLNGGLTQELVNSSGVAVTRTGEKMLEYGGDADRIPGYRGFLSVSLTGVPEVEKEQFFIGLSAEPPAIAFEAMSYPLSFNALSGNPTIGLDMNPADALIDLLSTKHGKAGIPSANIDRPSFIQAANTLAEEGHGFSRCFDGHMDLSAMVREICKQIDGVVAEDPSTGKVQLKLIRADFDPAATFSLTPSNCVLEEIEMIGTSSPVTSVRVNFRNRAKHYQQDSVVALNTALAVTTGETNEVEIDMPGITTRTLAQAVAEREVSFLSRPLMSARARVDRGAIRIVPGTVVNLTWPELGLSRRLFRVGHVERGAPGDDAITLYLIEDVSREHRGALETSIIPGFLEPSGFEVVPE